MGLAQGVSWDGYGRELGNLLFLWTSQQRYKYKNVCLWWVVSVCVCLYTVHVRISCVCLVHVWVADRLCSKSLCGLIEASSCLPVFSVDVLLVEEGPGRHVRHSAHSPSAMSWDRGSIFISLSVHLFLKVSHSWDLQNSSGSHQTIGRFPPNWSTWSNENMCCTLQMLAAHIKVLYVSWTESLYQLLPASSLANTARPDGLVIVWSDLKIHIPVQRADVM